MQRARIREIAGKVLEETKVGAGEAVNGLPVVTNAEEACLRILFSNRLHQTMEKFREILIFVNEHIPDSFEIAHTGFAPKYGCTNLNLFRRFLEKPVKILPPRRLDALEIRGVESLCHI